MHELYELKNRLCEELEEYKDKPLDKTNLDVIDKLSHTIKNLGKIIEQKEEEDGYSNMGYSNARRRDSRGRYSRDGMPMYSYDDEMISKLHKLMDEAPDERTRVEFKHFINKIEKM